MYNPREERTAERCPCGTEAGGPHEVMPVKRKKRVLVIDDEPAMAEWLQVLLEHDGYEVRTALTGRRGGAVSDAGGRTSSSPT